MDPLAVVFVVVAVVVVFFGVWAVIRHDRHAKESAGDHSDVDLQAENAKTREDLAELKKKGLWRAL